MVMNNLTEKYFENTAVIFLFVRNFSAKMIFSNWKYYLYII